MELLLGRTDHQRDKWYLHIGPFFLKINWVIRVYPKPNKCTLLPELKKLGYPITRNPIYPIPEKIGRVIQVTSIFDKAMPDYNRE